MRVDDRRKKSQIEAKPGDKVVSFLSGNSNALFCGADVVGVDGRVQCSQKETAVRGSISPRRLWNGATNLTSDKSIGLR